MVISVIGIDFRSARVDAREQVALTPAQVSQLLHVIVQEQIVPEAVVLSTCNRTEMYFASDSDHPADLSHLLAHHAEVRGLPAAIDESAFFRHDGQEAVRHLFRVASSLESQIVGEHEILGQAKEAYRLACEGRTAKFLFHKAMHWAFRVSKRVMTETGLGQGTASVASAAVDLSRQVFSNLVGKTVLMVGAGQTAELVCQALVRAGATSLVVANRTLANAQQLADSFIQWQQQEAQRDSAAEGEDEEPMRCPALIKMLEECPMRHPSEQEPAPQLRATAIALDQIPSVIADADLVICSSGAAEPVLRADELRKVLHNIKHSMLMIDIAVPRNIDPAVGDLRNVYLYNIDALEALVARNIERRRQEIPNASAIVDDEVEQFGRWLASLDVVPTIKLLAQRMADIQQAELARYLKKFPASEHERLQEFARTLCAKIMHDPISFLRRISDDGKSGQGLPTVSILRQMFNLDTIEEPEEDER